MSSKTGNAIAGQHWTGNLFGAQMGYIMKKNKDKVSDERSKTAAAEARNAEIQAELEASQAEISDMETQFELEASTLSPEEQIAAGAARRTQPQIRSSLLSQDAQRRKRSLLSDRSQS